MTAAHGFDLSIDLSHRDFGPATRRRIVPVMEQARMKDVLHVMRFDPDQVPAEDLQAMVPVWCLRQDAALYHEGARTETIYVVRSGSLKCVKTSEDGYQQVLSFADPGDVLAYESLHRGTHGTSAVALEVTTVFALAVQELDALRRHSAAFDHALQHTISRQLDGAGDVAELMAAVAADARLARFLLWVSARMAAQGQSSQRLRLRMCRRDIASLLGVAHETVSRSFTNLADEGLVEVLNRDIDILNFNGLRLRARYTRGATDDNPVEPVGVPHARPAPRRGPVPSPTLHRSWFSSGGWADGAIA